MAKAKYVNLLLRRQTEEQINSGRNIAKYSDGVVVARPCRDGDKKGFNLLTLDLNESVGHFFVELPSFQDFVGENKTMLSFGEVTKEFYCVEDFREDAKPIMRKATLTPTDAFKDLMINAYRAKKMSFSRKYPENATYELIATDGQHLLVKLGDEYTFLPYPYCDIKNWKLEKAEKKSKAELKKAVDNEIDNACEKVCERFSEHFYFGASTVSQRANFTRANLQGVKKSQEKVLETK